MSNPNQDPSNALVPVREMHVCQFADCCSPLVQLGEFHPSEENHQWHVELCCPECGGVTEGDYSQLEVERYEEELERGTNFLSGWLRKLEHEHMREEVEKFIVALQAGEIWPEDLGRVA